MYVKNSDGGSSGERNVIYFLMLICQSNSFATETLGGPS